MPGNAAPSNRALVDNWLLYKAVTVLGPGLPDSYKYDYDYNRDPNPYAAIQARKPRRIFPPRKRQDWPLIARNSMIALTQFLDLLVMSDELIYDATWAYLWRPKMDLERLHVVGIHIGEETRQRLPEITVEALRTDRDTTPEVISRGTSYYLALGQFLGIYYWPTPERAEYLAAHTFQPVGSNFGVAMSEFADRNLKDVAEQITAMLGEPTLPVNFPGFGSAVLAECGRVEDILPAILEYRKTKECQAFRAWLCEMDRALEAGDLATLARNMAEVNEVVDGVERGLRLKANTKVKAELQIGLSPAISVDLQTLDSIRAGLVPKKLHLTFLRRHFLNVLREANTWRTLQRLFPAIKDVRGIDA